MKHLVKAALIVFLSNVALYSQRPWVPKGTQWELINHQNAPWSPQPYYAVCSDTVLIQGIWCSEISPYLNCAPMSTQKQYLYEQDRRVYFHFQGAFYLMFDHNKAPGESYTTHFINHLLKVDSALVTIDSVFMTNGSCPKQVQVPVKRAGSGSLPYAYDDWIIEGQGYFPTIFPEYQGCDPVTASLLCFYEPGSCDDVPCIVSVHEPEHQHNALLVFPNPGSGLIQFSEPYSGLLTITDMTGKVVHQAYLEDQFSVQLSHLPKGLYLIRLLRHDQTIHQAKWLKSAD